QHPHRGPVPLPDERPGMAPCPALGELRVRHRCGGHRAAEPKADVDPRRGGDRGAHARTGRQPRRCPRKGHRTRLTGPFESPHTCLDEVVEEALTAGRARHGNLCWIGAAVERVQPVRMRAVAPEAGALRLTGPRDRAVRGKGASMETVGMVGVGAMGSALLERLRLADVSATVYDVAPAALERAGAQGATCAGSAAAVARAATLVDVVVRTDQEVQDAVLGPDGVLAGAAPGTLVLLHSTILPQTTRAVAEAARPRGVEVIDACMVGVPRVVRAG